MSNPEGDAAARREKLRKLEESLFGPQQSEVVGLPHVQDVGEYSVRYDDVFKEDRRQTTPPTKLEELPRFYKEPKKKVSPDLQDEFPQDETSSSAGLGDLTDRTELRSASSVLSQGSSVFHPTAPPLPSSSATPTRPGATPTKPVSTATKLLEEELKTLALDSNSDDILGIHQRTKLRRRSVSKREPTLYLGDEQTDAKVVNVGMYNDILGQAQLVSDQNMEQRNIDEELRIFRNSRNKKGRHPQIDNILNMEDNQLTMAMASAKLPSKFKPKFEPNLEINTPNNSENKFEDNFDPFKEHTTLPDRRKMSYDPLPVSDSKLKIMEDNLILNNERNKNKIFNVGLYDDVLGRAEIVSDQNHVAPDSGHEFKKETIGSDRKVSSKPRKRNIDDQAEEFRLRKMVSFDQLEKLSTDHINGEEMFNGLPTDTYKDMPGSDLFQDMPTDTFKDIPTDNLESIPRAITAKANARRSARMREVIADIDKDVKNKELATAIYNKEKDQEKALKNKYTEVSVNKVEKERESPVENIDKDKRLVVNDKDERRNELELPGPNEPVGFIAMLFQGAEAHVGARQSRDQLESDFMFAVFIQKQEENMGNNSAPPGPEEAAIGHFCAPFCPGFCEANHCIFHTDGP